MSDNDDMDKELAAAVEQQRKDYPDWPNDLGKAYQIVAGQCAHIATIIASFRKNTNGESSVFESIFYLEIYTRRWLQELKAKYDANGKIE